MLQYSQVYNSKLRSASEAISLVPSRGNLSMGMAASEPPALLRALEARIQAGEIEDLHIYYMHSERHAKETILKYEYLDRLKLFPMFVGPIERELTKLGLAEGKKSVSYVPCNFSNAPRLLQTVGIDAFIMTVGPMDIGGFLCCGTNADYTIPTARIAKKLIVEVNPNMPRVFGDCYIHVSQADVIVENAEPLLEMPARPLNDLDRKIGKYIVDMVPDRATVQFGVGGVPNAVCSALTDHKDLGVHSELMGPGLAALIQSGAVTNKYKTLNRHKNVYTIAMGDRALYDFLDENSSMEAYPVDYVNDPCVIGQNDNVVSVNAFIEIDFSGAVNAERIGPRQFSAPGGQLDFVRGAARSINGKSILASYATAAGGTISRIVPMLSTPATDPRTDTAFVVTEFGIADLKGKSTPERTIALIGIAHPKFRDELLAQARQMNYI